MHIFRRDDRGGSLLQLFPDDRKEKTLRCRKGLHGAEGRREGKKKGDDGKKGIKGMDLWGLRWYNWGTVVIYRSVLGGHTLSLRQLPHRGSRGCGRLITAPTGADETFAGG